MDHRRVRRGRALWRATPDTVVVAAVDGRTVHADGSAPAIWKLLPDHHDEPIALTTLVEQLVAEHGAPHARVYDDTVNVLEAWEAIGCAVLDS